MAKGGRGGLKKRAYIGIGSNISDKIGNCKKAIELLEKNTNIAIKKTSSFYETAPVGYKDQDWFVNCAVEIETDLKLLSLLSLCQAIESEMGRTREIKFGPRIIDLDILLYDNDIIDDKDLRIPHPEMHKRRFVLQTLSDIAPDIIHPVLKITIARLLRDVNNGGAVKKIVSPA